MPTETQDLTISDLGKRVKAKYPGTYDDISDDEVGRKVQAKYPGVYDDFKATPAAKQPPQDEGFFSGLVKGSQTLTALAHPLDTLGAVTGVTDLKDAGELAKSGDIKGAATKALHWMTSNPASRMAEGMLSASGEQLGKVKESFSKARKAYDSGDYAGVLSHIDNTINHLGAAATGGFTAGAAGGVEAMQEGRPSEGAGMVAGNVLDAALPKVAGKVAEVAPWAGAAVNAGVKAAAPEVIPGLAKVGAGAALAEVLPGGPIKYAFAAAPAYAGARQAMRGVGKGLSAARVAYTAAQEAAARLAAAREAASAPVSQGTPPVAPQAAPPPEPAPPPLPPPPLPPNSFPPPVPLSEAAYRAAFEKQKAEVLAANAAKEAQQAAALDSMRKAGYVPPDAPAPPPAPQVIPPERQLSEAPAVRPMPAASETDPSSANYSGPIPQQPGQIPGMGSSAVVAPPEAAAVESVPPPAVPADPLKQSLDDRAARLFEGKKFKQLKPEEQFQVHLEEKADQQVAEKAAADAAQAALPPPPESARTVEPAPQSAPATPEALAALKDKFNGMRTNAAVDQPPANPVKSLFQQVQEEAARRRAELEAAQGSQPAVAAEPPASSQVAPAPVQPEAAPPVQTGPPIEQGYLILEADGAPTMRVPVTDAEQASKALENYRDKYNLGGSAFREQTGNLITKSGTVIGKVSYNGRVWDEKGTPIWEPKGSETLTDESRTHAKNLNDWRAALEKGKADLQEALETVPSGQTPISAIVIERDIAAAKSAIKANPKALAGSRIALEDAIEEAESTLKQSRSEAGQKVIESKPVQIGEIAEPKAPPHAAKSPAEQQFNEIKADIQARNAKLNANQQPSSDRKVAILSPEKQFEVSKLGAEYRTRGHNAPDAAALKDIAIADTLRQNGWTADQWMALSDEQRSEVAKATPHPKQGSKFTGISKGDRNGAEDIADLLRKNPPTNPMSEATKAEIAKNAENEKGLGLSERSDAGPVPAQTPEAARVQTGESEPPKVAIPPPQPVQGPPIKAVATGRTTTVFTPNETPAQVRYEVVEGDQLKNSFDEGYNQDLQPRNTNRVGSRERIEAVKSNFNPEKMGESVNAGDGAPIILDDGTVVTRNHGTQAMREMSPEKKSQYRSFLENSASTFGYKPEDISGMKDPVLVRRFVNPPDPKELADFASESNMSSTARMSAAESAMQMAKRITPDMMDSFNPREDGMPNPEFAQAMFRDLPAQERAAYMDEKGQLSQAGVSAIRNAVFAKAYPQNAAIERLAESTDSNTRNISNGMLAAAPKFARIADGVARGDLHDLNIGEELAHTAEVISDLRDKGQSVDQWLKQENMFGRDKVVDALAETLTEFQRSPKRIGQFLKEYARLVESVGNPKQEGLFGAGQVPNRLEMINAAREATNEAIRVEREAGKSGELFPEGPPAGSPAAP